MDSYRKLGKNTLSMIIGSLGSKLISFLFVPFYTAVLSTEEYGISDLITTTITLLLPFFTLTIFESMMRFASDKEFDAGEVWKTGWNIEIKGVIVFLFLSPIIYFTILKEYFFFVIIYYISVSINHCIGYFTRGINQIKTFALAGTIQTTLLVVLSLILLVKVHMGIAGYLLAQILSSALASIYMFIKAKLYKYSFHIGDIDQKLQRDMLHYSLPMMPNSICWWVTNVSDRYLIVAFVGASVSGIYSVAYKIPSIISSLSSIFFTAWKLSAMETFNSNRSHVFFEDIYSKITAILILASSFLMVINKPFARILFSKDFYQAWEYVPILVMAASFHAYSDFFGSIYTAAYQTKFLVYSTLAGSIANVFLNCLLIPSFQGMGAAIATLIGYLIIWLWRVIDSRKIMKLRFHWKRDIMCYLLIILQLFIASCSFQYEYIYSGMIFLVICLFMCREIIDIFHKLSQERITNDKK